VPRIPLLLFFVLVLLVSHASASTISFSAPQEIAPLAIDSYNWRSSVHSVVADGNDYLVFWIAYPAEYDGRDFDLTVTRISEDGRPVAEKKLATLRDVRWLAAARRSGGGYLLAWSTWDEAATMVVSADLTPSDPVAAGEPWRAMRLACGQSRCMIVKQENFDLQTVLLDPDGRRVATPFSVPPGAGVSWRDLDVIASAHTFLVVFRTDRAPHRFVIIGEDGATLRDLERPGSSCGAGAEDGGYAIACIEAFRSIALLRIDERGRDLVSGSVPAPRIEPWWPSEVRVVASRAAIAVLTNVTRSLVTIPESARPSQIYAMRVSRSLFLFDREPIPITATDWANELASSASNGHSFLIGWNHSRTSSWYANGRLAVLPPIGSEAQPAGPIHLRMGSAAQFPEAIATSPIAHLAVWSENGEGQVSRLKAMRTGLAGQSLDPVPIDLGTSVRFHPAGAVSNGRVFAAVWQSHLEYSDRTVHGWVSTALIDAATGRMTIGPRIRGTLTSEISSDGRAFFMTIWRDREGFLVRIGPFGEVEREIPLGRYPLGPISVLGNRILIPLYHDGAYYAAVYSTDGSPIAESLIDRGDGSTPLTVSASDTHFYAFIQSRFLDRNTYRPILFVTRITADGVRLDGAGNEFGKRFATSSVSSYPLRAEFVNGSVVLFSGMDAIVFDEALTRSVTTPLGPMARPIRTAALADRSGALILGRVPSAESIMRVAIQQVTATPGGNPRVRPARR
jgi:hypothetical protein